MATEKMLIDRDTYLSVGVHIGAKFRTGFMKKYIYKIRPDGLAVLNIQKIDERIGLVAEMLSQFEPEEILVVCRRESGFAGAEKFAEVTGIPTITGRYLPGTLTNPNYQENYLEPKVMLVCDPWADKQALNDALKVNIPIIAFCDTNNLVKNVDLIVPCNNKGKRSLSLIFWVLATEYLKRKKKAKKLELSDFE
jgi:small subunit ribosomal protein S2